MNSGAEEKIADDIRTGSRMIQDPAGRSVRVIREADSVNIALKHDQPLGNIFIAALSADIWPCRYIRNHDTLSSSDQKTLAESCVAVIGCGGLGGYVLLMLSRIGVGSMVIVDPDVFDETNFNRQAFAISDAIGRHKVHVAVSVIKSVNPAVHVTGYQTALSYSNASKILNGSDVVVDALDNQPDRKMLQQAACRMKLPLVHGAIAGFEGQVMTILPDDRGLDDLFESGGQKAGGCGPGAESIMGIPSITPVFIASLQAMEVIKILLKRGKLLNGRILYSDIEQSDFNYFDFRS